MYTYIYIYIYIYIHMYTCQKSHTTFGKYHAGDRRPMRFRLEMPLDIRWSMPLNIGGFLGCRFLACDLI